MSPNDISQEDNVLVVTFGDDADNTGTPPKALTDLKQLDSQGQINVAGAAIVGRDYDGRVDVKSEVGDEPYVGIASGGLIGLLVGIGAALRGMGRPFKGRSSASRTFRATPGRARGRGCRTRGPTRSRASAPPPRPTARCG